MKQLNLTFLKKQDVYPIFIGTDIIEKIAELYDLSNYSKAFVITDKHIEPFFLDKLLHALPIEKAFLVLPPGEKAKHIETVQQIWTAMHQAACDRKSLVINLGGGVIGDMGGFAASTYMRGIDFINIPTTLLSQVDASVGGKTGIDFAGIKNFIGTFNQPKAVIIDTQTVTTLPKREFIAGFAEIIKHGLIKDKTFFEKVTSNHPLAFTQEEMIDVITSSCQIKTQIVQNDETENSTRKLLNFGHTIGHAIESLSLESSTPLLHGEAVSIGMIAEAKISELLGMFSSEDMQLIKQCLTRADLPVTFTITDKKQIFAKMLSDKKNEKGKINFTLLKSIGEAVYNQQVSEEIVSKAIDEITKKDL